MPTRTEDPPRTKPQIEVVPDRTRAAPAERPELETAHELPTHEAFRAILSHVERAGSWEAADELELLAVCGNVTLDFRRAELPPSGAVEIDARAICGAIEIIVPDGAEVEIEGTPFVGSIEQHLRGAGVRERIREWVTGERDDDAIAPPLSEEPPLFRIFGQAIFGSIRVTGR